MENIKIKIPIGLTEREEFIMITNQLGKRLLPANNQKLLNGYEIKEAETKITILREHIKKPIVMLECFCGTQFEKKIGKILYVNYGGIKKQKRYCSNECRQQVIDIAGKRCSIKPSKLKLAVCY